MTTTSITNLTRFQVTTRSPIPIGRPNVDIASGTILRSWSLAFSHLLTGTLLYRKTIRTLWTHVRISDRILTGDTLAIPVPHLCLVHSMNRLCTPVREGHCLQDIFPRTTPIPRLLHRVTIPRDTQELAFHNKEEVTHSFPLAILDNMGSFPLRKILGMPQPEMTNAGTRPQGMIRGIKADVMTPDILPDEVIRGILQPWMIQGIMRHEMIQDTKIPETISGINKHYGRIPDTNSQAERTTDISHQHVRTPDTRLYIQRGTLILALRPLPVLVLVTSRCRALLRLQGRIAPMA